MTDPEFDFLPLRIKHISTNGKRWYDPVAKRRLVAACQQPGASIAGSALRAQVNANQLHKWIRIEEKRSNDRSETAVQCASAFVPVVTVDGGMPVATQSRAPVSHSKVVTLSAQLPNGVTLRLEGVGREDEALLTAMIASLSAN